MPRREAAHRHRSTGTGDPSAAATGIKIGLQPAKVLRVTTCTGRHQRAPDPAAPHRRRERGFRAGGRSAAAVADELRAADTAHLGSVPRPLAPADPLPRPDAGLGVDRCYRKCYLAASSLTVSAVRKSAP